jgi:hypothetical protein
MLVVVVEEEQEQEQEVMGRCSLTPLRVDDHELVRRRQVSHGARALRVAAVGLVRARVWGLGLAAVGLGLGLGFRV